MAKIAKDGQNFKMANISKWQKWSKFGNGQFKKMTKVKKMTKIKKWPKLKKITNFVKLPKF